MRSVPGLDELLIRARERGVVGTKMRSVILHADQGGIAAVLQEQFEYATRIAAHGLVPIIEPEVDLQCPDRPHAEQLLRARLLEALGAWQGALPVMLKLTIPAVDNAYADLTSHANVLRVVALSGGYSQEEACTRLAHNRGLIASFSRALLEGLTAQLDDTRFNHVLEASCARIYAASTNKG
jgi:fructose-bisphosphate aldolase class I